MNRCRSCPDDSVSGYNHVGDNSTGTYATTYESNIDKGRGRA